MITYFTALLFAGGATRLALNWQLKQRWGVVLGVPQALAVLLVILAGLPELLKPFPYPIPLSVTVGLLLPDLFFRRASI